MILPDVNLLVYAHNEESRFHAQARPWWTELLTSQETVFLPWAVVIGFIRIVTHPSVLIEPLTAGQAFALTDTWLEFPTLQVVHPGRAHYRILRNLLHQAGTAGNLTTDAHLAALAIEHQCELHSNDADFGRFSGLRWINPLAASK